MPRLRQIGISYGAIEDYSPINRLKFLTKLNIQFGENPSVNNLAFLQFSPPNLRKMHIGVDELPSLVGIENALYLEELIAEGWHA